MRVLVNCIYASGRMRRAGYGTYLLNMLEQWSRLDGEERFLLAWPAEPGLRLSQRFDQLVIPWSGGPARPYLGKILGSRRCREFKPQVVFQPNLDLPYAFPSGMRLACVVHDMIPTLFMTPGYLLKGKTPFSMINTYGLVKLWECKRGLRNVDLIVAVSRTTRDCFLKTVGGACAGKVRVIYNGTDSVPRPRRDQVIAFLREQNLSYKDYLVYFGGHTARKNLGLALRAYLDLPHALKLRCPLVILGNDPRPKRTRNAGLREGVRLMPGQPREQLALLVSGAALSLYASLYEGFGMPVLESLNLGTLPLASDIPSTRELCGDLVPLFNPRRQQELGALLQYYLSQPARISARLERAVSLLNRRLTWSRCARETMGALRGLLERSP